MIITSANDRNPIRSRILDAIFIGVKLWRVAKKIISPSTHKKLNLVNNVIIFMMHKFIVFTKL